jgi:SNF2 family DNA or RNA helicase
MPYQEYAASFAASKDAALLALDMGLGKTPTAIAAWSRCKDMGKVTKGMVFVPDSVRENWRNEIGKFTNHRVGMYRSQAEVRKMSPAAQQNYEREMADAELIICGHGAFVGTSEQAKHDAKVEASMNKIRIARGAGASQEEIGRLSNAHADLVSQNKERSDESNLEQLQRFGCDSLIMDEAHALKNPDSNRARDFENHLTGLKHRILLTGTPMPNTPTDLYHMIGRVKKGLVASSLGQFVQKYIDRTYGITETGHVWHRDDAYKNLDQLFHSAKPAMLALHARDPHVLAQQKDMGIAVPEGIHEDPRQLQMSGAQDELYRLFKQEGKDILNDLNPNGDSEAKKKALLMTLGQRMEQISIDPTMIKMEDINGDGIVASDRMHKIRGLLQRAQEETHAASGAMKLKEAARIAIEHHTQGGKGVVIHANYTQSIPSLRRALEAAGFHGDDILELSGETSKGNRQKHVDSFNNPNSRGRVMIVTSAAREGVNLQGNNDKFGPHNSGGGSLDIMLSHAWLPGDEDQARARIERIGQDQTTRHVVLHAVTSTGKETVDQVKYRRIKAKGEAIAQAVLGRPGERVEIPQTAFDDEAADATFRGDD